MRSNLPVITLSAAGEHMELCVAILACGIAQNQNVAIALLLHPLSDLPRHQGTHRIYASNISWILWNRYRVLILDAGDGVRVNGRVARQGYAEQPDPCSNKRMDAEIVWKSIHVLHRPLPHMRNHMNSKFAGGISTWGFHLSSWSAAELRRWGFHPQDDIPSSPYVSTSLYMTFAAARYAPRETFTVAVWKYDFKFNSPITVATVTFSSGDVTSILRPSSDPNTSSEHAGMSVTSDDFLPGVVCFREEQDWTLKFGDAEREVKLYFHRQSGRVRHKASTFTPVLQYYRVDISLSGRVYTTIRDSQK